MYSKPLSSTTKKHSSFILAGIGILITFSSTAGITMFVSICAILEVPLGPYSSIVGFVATHSAYNTIRSLSNALILKPRCRVDGEFQGNIPTAVKSNSSLSQKQDTIRIRNGWSWYECAGVCCIHLLRVQGLFLKDSAL